MHRDDEVAPPAPWTLTGRGFVALYRLPRGLWAGRAPLSAADPVHGRFALVMLVDYDRSPVGPYRELLVVAVRPGWRAPATIPRIVVDSAASVAGGRANWAIPKELATIDVSSEGASERWRVTANDRTWIDVRVTPRRATVPVTTALLPGAARALRQPRADGTWWLCPLAATGRLGRAGWELASADPEAFVDLAGARCLGAFSVPRFRLTFAPARPM